MNVKQQAVIPIKDRDINLERDGFCRCLIRELAGTLEDIVGLDEAEGFISVVGQKIGNMINDLYKTELNVDHLDKDQLADVLVDLKSRIHGKFYVTEQTQDATVLKSDRCPFEEMVLGRPSLCMMTSNVFGTIVAKNMGYAKVNIDNAIARGDSHCSVKVYHSINSAEGQPGREYFSE